MTPAQFLALGALLLVLPIGALLWSRARHRNRIREAENGDFPPEWDQLLGAAFPLYQRIPVAVREPLRKRMLAFIADKNFEACGELQEVTNEMKLLVAVQACLLVWDDERLPPYPELRSILLYPRAFARRETKIRPDYGDQIEPEEADDFGGERVLLGESWDTGSVVLSWASVQQGGSQPHDGTNVVIHEFAHQLDQEAGVADGLPQLGTSEEHQAWATAFTVAWERFNDRLERAEYEEDLEATVIDPYGATNPAEFFAVASETFFERPRRFQQRYPDVYRELERFYRLDPASWSVDVPFDKEPS